MTTTKTRSHEYLTTLTYHVPPQCQGQAVELAYAAGEDEIVQRTTDRSDGEVTYAVAVQGDDFQPWTSEPARSWTPVRAQ